MEKSSLIGSRFMLMLGNGKDAKVVVVGPLPDRSFLHDIAPTHVTERASDVEGDRVVSLCAISRDHYESSCGKKIEGRCYVVNLNGKPAWIRIEKYPHGNTRARVIYYPTEGLPDLYFAGHVPCWSVNE